MRIKAKGAKDNRFDAQEDQSASLVSSLGEDVGICRRLLFRGSVRVHEP